MNKLFKLLILILAVLIINGCSGKKSSFKVLLRMMPAQKDFYLKKVIPEFEKKHNCKIDVITFDQSSKIEDFLKLEKNKAPEDRIAVVKTPFEMTRVLAKKGYMAPLRTVVDPAVVDMDEAAYYAFARRLGYVNKVQYYFPRKLETRILVFLKSKVNEAVNNWATMKDNINSKLKKENGFGLPKDYNLESDPNKWDNYDLYVVGYYWSHKKYEDGVYMPRIAHRSKKYLGTALGLIERSYRLGASFKDVETLDSSKVIDMFNWERVYIADSIYNPAMWQDQWSGSDIYKGFQSGKVFLADMQQIDCFLLHGWKELPEMNGYVKDPEDLGYALMPQGVSFELDKDGNYVYTGNKRATNGGWWWGIPKTATQGKLAYEFIKFVTSKKIQAQEVAKFGILPVRKDIINKIPSVFDQGWVGEMFKVSSQQLKINDTTSVPLVDNYTDIANNYVSFWNDVLVNGVIKGDIKTKDDIVKAIKSKK